MGVITKEPVRLIPAMPDIIGPGFYRRENPGLWSILLLWIETGNFQGSCRIFKLKSPFGSPPQPALDSGKQPQPVTSFWSNQTIGLDV